MTYEFMRFLSKQAINDDEEIALPFFKAVHYCRFAEYCVNSPYPKPGLKSLKRRAGVHRSQGQTPRRQRYDEISHRIDSGV